MEILLRSFQRCHTPTRQPLTGCATTLYSVLCPHRYSPTVILREHGTVACTALSFERECESRQYHCLIGSRTICRGTPTLSRPFLEILQDSRSSCHVLTHSLTQRRGFWFNVVMCRSEQPERAEHAFDSCMQTAQHFLPSEAARMGYKHCVVVVPAC